MVFCVLCGVSHVFRTDLGSLNHLVCEAVSTQAIEISLDPALIRQFEFDPLSDHVKLLNPENKQLQTLM